jgi:anti-sigma B factor antagonist
MIHHFDLDHEEDGTRSSLHLAGDLDIAAAPRLRRVLGDLMGSGVREVTVDLEETEFVDSSGLGALLWADHRLTAIGGELTIVNPCEHVARTFALAGLDSLIVH